MPKENIDFETDFKTAQFDKEWKQPDFRNGEIFQVWKGEIRMIYFCII